MHLHEIDLGGKRAVAGYGPGFFRIGGEVHLGAIALTAEGVRTWGGWTDRDFAGIDLLLVGCGAGFAPLPADFRAALEGRGIAVEPMATAPACRGYNMLLSEGRRVGLAAFPV